MSDKRSDSQSPGQASHHSVISKARASHTPFTGSAEAPERWASMRVAEPDRGGPGNLVSQYPSRELGRTASTRAIDSDEGLLRIEQLLGELALSK